MVKYDHTIETYENGEWYSWKKAVYPFKLRRTLDESLDTGRFDLKLVKRYKPFAPFTPVRISTIQDTGESKIYNMVVTRDSVEQRSFTEPYMYNHAIELIELTKLLEREICDTITFTNSLARNFTTQFSMDNYFKLDKLDGGRGTHETPSSYLTPYSTDVPFIINPYIGTWSTDNIPLGIKLNVTFTLPNGTTQVYTFTRPEPGFEPEPWTPANYSVMLKTIGTWRITYDYINYKFGESHYTFHYDFYTGKETEKKTYTITKVLERILSVYTTRRKGLQVPKYTLDPAIAERYKDMVAPEFYITKSTLFEALSQVGGYIHSIPRLLPDGVITFNELGTKENITAKGSLVAREIMCQSDQFCAEIDTQADNLINTTDTLQGSVEDPCHNAYKTTRCEEGKVEISDATAEIILEYDAYKINKVEMGYLVDGKLVGSITPYIYEAAEYGALSGYSDLYPDSKGYALVYTQGSNKISALNFKLEDAVSPALKVPALQNIVDAVTGTSNNLDKTYKNLAFRVTYIPIMSARIKQRKTMPEDFSGSLIYNQNSNSAEAEAYGESLKGVIAKLGNVTEVRTYRVTKLINIPNPGQIIEDMYIASVDEEYYYDCVKYTLTLTADYNKLSEYIGINSNYRLFDVSEKQSVDRYINYGEALLIGDEDNYGEVMVSVDAMPAFADVFTQSGKYVAASHAIINGESDGTPVQTPIIHSCLSYASGNSLVFSWQHQDNYSAGYKAAPYDANKNTQQYVPYGDPYGELETIGNRIGYFNNPVTSGYANDINALPNSYPQYNDDNIETVYFDTANYPYLVAKDSRENIICTYQLHMQQNRKEIVIGSALTQNNPLVRGTEAKLAARFVWLPENLNKFARKVDLAGAVEENRTNYIVGGTKQFHITPYMNNNAETFKAWAFIDIDGDLIIGENGDIAPGESTKAMYFTPKNI